MFNALQAAAIDALATSRAVLCLGCWGAGKTFLVEAVRGAHPEALLIDDAHRLPALDVLRQVADALGSRRLVLVTAYPDTAPALFDALVRAGLSLVARMRRP